MRIAQIPGDQVPFSPKLPFSTASIPMVSYLITEELVKLGHQVTVFAPSDSKTSAEIAPGWIKSTDPKFKKFPALSKKRNDLFQKYCQNIVRQANNFDIIHNHCHGFFPYIKKIKTSVITTLHNPDFDQVEKKKYRWVMLVGISQRQIKNNPGLNFVGQVWHGLNLKDFPFNPKPKNYLFWLSRISPIKGPLEAIEIAKLSGKKLILAGTYGQKDEYIKKILTEIKTNKNLKLVGNLNYRQKINYYKNALAFIFPIQWEEPFGLVMIEALACGTPVIAFARGAAPEIVKNGETGFIVKTIPEMVRAIKKLKTINRKKCRQRVEKYFTAKKMAQGYEKIYQKVIKRFKK